MSIPRTEEGYIDWASCWSCGGDVDCTVLVEDEEGSTHGTEGVFCRSCAPNVLRDRWEVLEDGYALLFLGKETS